MTPFRASTLRLAAALLLSSSAARAQGGSRSGDAGMSGPVISPTVNANTPSTTLGPTLTTPGMNTIPGANVNTGVTLSNGAQAQGAVANMPSAGAASIGAPTAAQIQAQAENVQAGTLPGGEIGPAGETAAAQLGAKGANLGAHNPGSSLLNPAQDGRDGEKRVGSTATGALHGAASEIGRAQKLDSMGADGTTAQALDKVFDAARASTARVGSGAPGLVAGKTERVQDQVRQTVKIADTASAHDAPALYKDAIKIAEQASLQKLISGDTARAVAETVVRYAMKRAARALPDLANEAYKAAQNGDAGKPAVEKAFKSIGAWNAFLGGGETRPLVANQAELRADVERSLSAAVQAGSRRNGVAPRVTFRREGAAFVAELPMRAAGGAAALPQDFLKGLALDARTLGKDLPPALALTETPGVLEGARLVYGAHRRAGRSVPSAVASASSFAARAVWRSLWERVVAVASAAWGRLLPGRVDLGAGQALVSYDRALSRLSALKREPTTDEQALLAQRRPGVASAFFDLSRLNRAARAAEQAASRGAATAGALKRMLALLSDESAVYAALTGDRSAVAAAASLRARAVAALTLADDAPLSEDLRALAAPETAGGIAFWLARLPQAALDHLDRQMLAVAERGGLAAVGFGDLSDQPGAMARLVARAPSPALVAELEGLGFETELGAGGVLRAWASGPALSARLEAALDRASGASAVAAADAAAVSRAAAYAVEHPADARREAQRLQAEDPAFTGFTPSGLVQSQGRPLWAESALRREGGKLSRVVLLRDADSRRPLFGHAEPLLAH
jgi:hypothetical protein